MRDNQAYERAAADPEAYWSEWAQQLDWYEPWEKVREWDPLNAKWFVGGKLNACYNCVDRHVKNGLRNKAAIIWEGEPGDRRTLTYWDLYGEVNRFANALKARGIKRGDRVAIYMPMIPELAIAMLACARIGAVHSIVFGGFSAATSRCASGRAATTGGIASCRTLSPTASRNAWTPRTCSIHCTPPGPRAGPRASSTPRAAI